MDLRGEKWKLKKKREREEERRQQQPPPSVPEAPRTGPFSIVMTPQAQTDYDELSADKQRGADEVIERIKAWPEVSGTQHM